MVSIEGIRVSEAPEDLIVYGYDASGLEQSPAMVAWPESTEQVSRLLIYASERGMPVVPRGAGTGMTGGSIPLKGSMALSFERMNRIIEIDADNLTVLVEPGVIMASGDLVAIDVEALRILGSYNARNKLLPDPYDSPQIATALKHGLGCREYEVVT